MKSNNIALEPEKAHGAALKNWLSKGGKESLQKCHNFISNGVSCVDGRIKTSAAIQFLTKQWEPKWATANAELFRLYLSSGQIGLDVPMVVPSQLMYRDEDGHLPLDVAIRYCNVDAAVVLIEVGALDVTDFRSIRCGYYVHKLDVSRLDAFDKYASEQWISHYGSGVDFEPIRAVLTAAVMRRQISVSVASVSSVDSGDLVKAPAPRRRAMGL